MPSKRLIENTRLKTPINIPSGQLLQRPLTHLVLSFRLLLCLLQHPLVCWNTLPISTTLNSLTPLPPAPNSSQPAPPATRQSCASSTPTFPHSPDRAPRSTHPRCRPRLRFATSGGRIWTTCNAVSQGRFVGSAHPVAVFADFPVGSRGCGRDSWSWCCVVASRYGECWRVAGRRGRVGALWCRCCC